MENEKKENTNEEKELNGEREDTIKTLDELLEIQGSLIANIQKKPYQNK